jgi:lipoprotein signal peptidase
MNRATRAAAASPVRPERNEERRRPLLVPALLVVVIVLDQATKWWAWRHSSAVMINDGGDVLVGDTVSGWYAAPVAGALLDLVGFGFLSAAVSVLIRRRRPVVVLVPAALMIAGWGSNLLDRLGLHYWTAPGSVRGAVDFMPLGSHRYNVADLFIVGATPLFLLAAAFLYVRLARRPAGLGPVAPATRRRPRARIWAFAGAVGIVGVVGLGAANHGGVNFPVASAVASDYR